MVNYFSEFLQKALSLFFIPVCLFFIWREGVESGRENMEGTYIVKSLDIAGFTCRIMTTKT